MGLIAAGVDSIFVSCQCNIGKHHIAAVVGNNMSSTLACSKGDLGIFGCSFHSEGAIDNAEHTAGLGIRCADGDCFIGSDDHIGVDQQSDRYFHILQKGNCVSAVGFSCCGNGIFQACITLTVHTQAGGNDIEGQHCGSTATGDGSSSTTDLIIVGIRNIQLAAEPLAAINHLSRLNSGAIVNRGALYRQDRGGRATAVDTVLSDDYTGCGVGMVVNVVRSTDIAHNVLHGPILRLHLVFVIIVSSGIRKHQIRNLCIRQGCMTAMGIDGFVTSAGREINIGTAVQCQEDFSGNITRGCPTAIIFVVAAAVNTAGNGAAGDIHHHITIHTAAFRSAKDLLHGTAGDQQSCITAIVATAIGSINCHSCTAGDRNIGTAGDVAAAIVAAIEIIRLGAICEHCVGSSSNGLGISAGDIAAAIDDTKSAVAGHIHIGVDIAAHIQVGITDNIAVIAAAVDFGIFAGQQGQVCGIRSAAVLAAKDLYGIGHGHTGTHLYLIAVCIKTDILSKGQGNILKRDVVA